MTEKRILSVVVAVGTDPNGDVGLQAAVAPLPDEAFGAELAAKLKDVIIQHFKDKGLMPKDAEATNEVNFGGESGTLQ